VDWQVKVSSAANGYKNGSKKKRGAQKNNEFGQNQPYKHSNQPQAARKLRHLSKLVVARSKGARKFAETTAIFSKQVGHFLHRVVSYQLFNFKIQEKFRAVGISRWIQISAEARENIILSKTVFRAQCVSTQSNRVIGWWVAGW